MEKTPFPVAFSRFPGRVSVNMIINKINRGGVKLAETRKLPDAISSGMCPERRVQYASFGQIV